MHTLISSLRIVVVSMIICVACYTVVVLGVARVLAPDSASGSLLTRAGAAGPVMGSRFIAQKFEQPAYCWPRPSAVDYNGAGAGGSNKSPTSAELSVRARALIARYEADATRPLPPELAAASGGRLDPHITEHAALYQAARIAAARGVDQRAVEAVIRSNAVAPGWVFTPDRLVNVLELNIALDQSMGIPARVR